jgi:hypothetical protein
MSVKNKSRPLVLLDLWSSKNKLHNYQDSNYQIASESFSKNYFE